MHRAHVIRMYPTKEQEVMLKKTAGTARYAYNWALATWKDMYAAWMDDHSKPKPSAFGLSKLWTESKPDWAREVSFSVQQIAIHQLGKAFQNLWRGIGKYPTFHKKGKRRDSFTIANDKAKLYGDHIQLPYIGRVRLAEIPRFTGEISNYTVSTYAGQWHVSIQYDLPEPAEHICLSPSSIVGLDVGLKHIAVASDGTVCDAPASLKKLDQKLKKSQQKLSRKQQVSSNYAKALIKKQRIQNKINNIRKDTTHKFTTALTKNHGIVVTEDLHIQDMKNKAEHKSLRRSYASSMMGMILWQIHYKALDHRKVDRFYPSTKKCSSCGHVKDRIDLGERTYVCEHCGAVIDRDLNAAINLKNAGPVRPVAPVDSVVNR